MTYVHSFLSLRFRKLRYFPTRQMRDCHSRVKSLIQTVCSMRMVNMLWFTSVAMQCFLLSSPSCSIISTALKSFASLLVASILRSWSKYTCWAVEWSRSYVDSSWTGTHTNKADIICWISLTFGRYTPLAMANIRPFDLPVWNDDDPTETMVIWYPTSVLSTIPVTNSLCTSWNDVLLG